MKANSKLVVPLATMAVAAAVTIGSGATWTAQEPTTTTVASGNLQMDADGATLVIGNMKPGDSRTGTLTITNTGTVDAALTMSETDVVNTFWDGDNDPLTTSAASDLTLTIEQGGVEIYAGDFDNWVGTTPETTDTNRALGTLVAGTSADAATTLTFTVKLSEAAHELSQDQAASARYTFVTTPTAGTSVNLPFSD